MTAVMHQSEISDATIESAFSPVSPHDLDDHQNDLLTEAILEQFYSHGISDEFMAAQAKAEAYAFDTKSEGTILAPAIRRVSLICLQRMASLAALEIERWYEAVTLFDLYCLRCERDVAELQESLPVLCGAIFRLVAKQQNQSACIDGPILVSGAQFMKMLIDTFSISATPVTISGVNKKEMEVLERLDWKVALPTVHSWSVSILGRFSAVTGQNILARMSWLWQQHTAVKMAQIIQFANPSELAPRHFAVGLFAIGLVRANMLPINIIFPKDDEARKHFLEFQPEGFRSYGDSNDYQYKVLVQQVEIATGASLASIQKHCCALMMVSSACSKNCVNSSLGGA